MPIKCYHTILLGIFIPDFVTNNLMLFFFFSLCFINLISSFKKNIVFNKVYLGPEVNKILGFFFPYFPSRMVYYVVKY